MSKDKKIKILIIAPTQDVYMGGQAVQAARLLENFQNEPQIQVGFQTVNPQIFPRLQKIKYVRTLLRLTKYIFDLLIKIPRYDVIHIFSASYFAFLLFPTPAVLIARLFGKKTILNYRSGEARDHLETWGRSAIPTIRLFDKIITPSGYLVDVFAEFGLRAQTIFNFVNTDKYRFRERKPLRPVFLSNRNFESLYNVACTLRAFALIQKEFPDAELIVAGDGQEKLKLYQLAEELNLKNIEFPGRILQEKMPELYDRADVYLNSPNIDNMPSSVIEAFSCGLPVVSTNAGGIPYIVENGETGLLVEMNDHAALARAAMRILEIDELAQKIIVKARRECIKYSWINVCGHWLEIYQTLASEELRPAQIKESKQ